jgi:hypothetical protein
MPSSLRKGLSLSVELDRHRSCHRSTVGVDVDSRSMVVVLRTDAVDTDMLGCFWIIRVLHVDGFDEDGFGIEV